MRQKVISPNNQIGLLISRGSQPCIFLELVSFLYLTNFFNQNADDMTGTFETTPRMVLNHCIAQ